MNRMSRRRSAQQGFSLVELMIASAISLAIVASLVTVFVGSTRSRNELDASNQQIENGRFALELLAEELRVAGFYGEVSLAGAAFAADAPACAVTATQLKWQADPLRVPVPVQSVPVGAAGSACLSNRAAATPAIAIRRVATEAVVPAAIVANNQYLQTSRCDEDPAATKLAIGDSAAGFTLRNLGCTAAMPVRQILQRTYYLASCSNCGRDSIPSLARIEMADGQLQVRTMVEGIEAMGLEFGFDVNGDGAPDEWGLELDGIAGSPANDWSNVMAVKLNLLSRTLRPTPGYVDDRRFDLGLAGTVGPFSDGFKRRIYSGVVRLNNPSGRREL